MEHTPRRGTCDHCEVNWDRKGNVETVVLCPLHAAAPELLKALEGLMWIADAAWRNAIMATDAPMPAKLAKVEEGSPEAKQAHTIIKAAKEDA